MCTASMLTLLVSFLVIGLPAAVRCESGSTLQDVVFWNAVVVPNRTDSVHVLLPNGTQRQEFEELLQSVAQLESGTCFDGDSCPEDFRGEVVFGNDQLRVSFDKDSRHTLFDFTQNQSFVSEAFSASIVSNPDKNLKELLTKVNQTFQNFRGQSPVKRVLLLVVQRCPVVEVGSLNAPNASKSGQAWIQICVLFLTSLEAEKCREEFATTSWAPFVDFFAVDSINETELEHFASMEVQYVAAPIHTVLNMAASINWNYLWFIQEFVSQRAANSPLCADGLVAFLLQVRQTNDVSYVSKFVLPVDFGASANSSVYFDFNFERLVAKGTPGDSIKTVCSHVNSFMNQLVRASDEWQFNVLVIDEYPLCVQFDDDHKWRFQARMLEIIMFDYNYSAQETTSTEEMLEAGLDLISWGTSPQTRPNHAYAINLYSQSIAAMFNYNTVCQNQTSTTPFIRSPKNDGSGGSAWKNIAGWVGGLVGIILFAAVVVGITWFCSRKKMPSLRKETTLDDIMLAKMHLSPLEAHLSQQERALLQLDSKNVVIDFQAVLGKGANATVYKAFLKGPSKLHSTENRLETAQFCDCAAAVKVSVSVGVDEVEEFVRELDALRAVGPNPHVIALLGWTLHRDSPSLVFELVHTDLLTFCRDLRSKWTLPVRRMLAIAWQIAQAMERVASLGLCHRDLAARNILLTESLSARVADFGLCCRCDESFTYRASIHKRLPLKWLSPEALVDRLFSEKSDVWAFGVLLWEVFSYGAVPYPALSNQQMLQYLQDGKRLERPEAMPETVQELVQECWKEQPMDRPTFSHLGKELRVRLETETDSYGYLVFASPPQDYFDDVEV